MINAVNAAKPGEEMELTVDRDGESKKIVVTLGDRPASTEDSQSGPVGPPSK